MRPENPKKTTVQYLSQRWTIAANYTAKFPRDTKKLDYTGKV